MIADDAVLYSLSFPEEIKWPSVWYLCKYEALPVSSVQIQFLDFPNL